MLPVEALPRDSTISQTASLYLRSLDPNRCAAVPARVDDHVPVCTRPATVRPAVAGDEDGGDCDNDGGDSITNAMKELRQRQATTGP